MLRLMLILTRERGMTIGQAAKDPEPYKKVLRS
jgi:hypothetical protein